MSKGSTVGYSVAAIGLVIALIALWFAIGGFILMAAWNVIAVPLFGVAEITYIQGIGAAVLFWIISLFFRGR